VSLDKDVMDSGDATVNWDSGYLNLGEIEATLTTFLGLAGGRLAGADIVGDWSPVRAHGWLRRWLLWMEHPTLNVDAVEAARLNDRTNRRLLAAFACPAVAVAA